MKFLGQFFILANTLLDEIKIWQENSPISVKLIWVMLSFCDFCSIELS